MNERNSCKEYACNVCSGIRVVGTHSRRTSSFVESSYLTVLGNIHTSVVQFSERVVQAKGWQTAQKWRTKFYRIEI